MTERRRRGASWSSNCFQTSSAFGFLFFIFRSRVGIWGVKSRKFTGKRYDKDLTPRPGPDRVGIPGKSRGTETVLRSKVKSSQAKIGQRLDTDGFSRGTIFRRLPGIYDIVPLL